MNRVCPECGHSHTSTVCPFRPLAEQSQGSPEPMVFWRDQEPPGSPAYVRRLRDQAAVALRTMPPDRDGLFYENEHAVAEANALMADLGYPVPEDTP